MDIDETIHWLKVLVGSSTPFQEPIRDALSEAIMDLYFLSKAVYDYEKKSKKTKSKV